MDAQGALSSVASLFLYNPSRLPREELKRLYLARDFELSVLLESLRAVRDSLQHHLLIAERGMGKTTVLCRFAYAIEEDPELSDLWIPLRFDEEQYNVGGLADLWLNALGEGAKKVADRSLSERKSEIEKKHGSSPEKLAEKAFDLLRILSLETRRKIVLLVDNIDIILDRLTSIEMKKLRENLTDQEEPWLILAATSSKPIAATFDYDGPLYELFAVMVLKALSVEQASKLLKGLAAVFGSQSEADAFLGREDRTFETLAVFLGGNPRLLTRLFIIIPDSLNSSLEEILEHLLDLSTSEHKAEIENLPAQAQRVFAALALNWNPATAEQIAAILRIDRGAASAQLHRLVDRGLVSKARLPERPIGFLVKNRFLNTWFLMRRAGLNNEQLRSVLKFLRIFNGRRETKQKNFRNLITSLENLQLLDDALRAKFLAKIRELETDNQMPLMGLQLKEEILALCNLGRFDQAQDLTNDLLRIRPESLFAKVVRAHLFEMQDRIGEAAKILGEITSSAHVSDWLRIEHARLLFAVGDARGASQTLAPLMNQSELPVSQLTHAAINLAESGGESVAWLSQELVNRAKEIDPNGVDVLLSSCRLELLLSRPDRASEIMKSILKVFDEDSPDQIGFETIELLIELARRGQAENILPILRENGFSDRWLPLVFALESIVEPDETVLKKLAPELLEFTEQVLSRIKSARENDQ